MSGHSKWNNIKRKKGAADAQRGVLFTKLGREIQVAVKDGGPDPESNSKLKDVIAKAKSSNMPNDNIQRSIKKASGLGSDAVYLEIMYEGYGVSGVAVIVKTLTDNKNRTAADVRHLFDKFGGNMGTSGCVSFMFQEKGQLILLRENYDEETVMMDALDVGAEDMTVEDEIYIITTAPKDYTSVLKALEAKDYVFESYEMAMVPDNWVIISDEDQKIRFEKMIENLEDHGDVTEVYHNCEN